MIPSVELSFFFFNFIFLGFQIRNFLISQTELFVCCCDHGKVMHNLDGMASNLNEFELF